MRLVLALALLFFLIGVATLSDYGITWDSPHRFMRGQAYVEYFLTGKTSFGQPKRLSPNIITPGSYMTRFDFLSGEGDKPVELPDRPMPQTEFGNLGFIGSFYQSDWWNGDYFNKLNPAEFGHWPLPEILGALSNRIFFQRLRWLPDIESYHLPYVAISTLGVLIVGILVFQATGSRLASLVASLTLATYPIFFAESHFNLKDSLVATFFAGSIWAFWRWLILNRLRWFFIFIAFVALSLSVKWNIMFLPLIIVPWLWTIRRTDTSLRWFKPQKLGIFGIIAVILICAYLYAIWPMVWQAPFATFRGVIGYYLQIGTGMESIEPPGFIGPLGIKFYPILLLLSQMPEVVLILLILGLVAVFGGKVNGHRVGILVFLWLFVPIIRYSFPGIRVYSGYRQIFEVLPAIAVMSGFGMDYILKLSWDRVRKGLELLVISLYVVFIVDLIRIHPNQNAYFNRLAGGLPGAYDKNLVDFFLSNGNIYRQASNWLNANAEDNANIAILDGRMAALSSLWLRKDLSISPYHFSGFARAGEYILSLDTKLEKPIFSYGYPRRFLTPVGQIPQAGQPILFIYKNDDRFLKSDYKSEQPLMVTPRRIEAGSGDYIEIDLGETRKITRIIVKNAASGCQRKLSAAFIDEVITFIADRDDTDSLRDKTYGIMERVEVSPDVVEYLFPGEAARFIRIYPKSQASCFAGGVVPSVMVLP